MKLHNEPFSAGFTLVELVAVIAMVGLLASMLAPTLAHTKPNSATFQCMNNLRQLEFAWKLYADDNSGNLVYNTDGGNVGKSLGNEAWVGGWMDYYPNNTDNTNTALLINHDRYPFGAYLGPYIKTPMAFKCPSDRSLVPMADGPKPRVRSVSMNCYVGTHGRPWNSPSRYGLFEKLEQIKSPVNMFVILDEREDSINDGHFYTDPDTLYKMVEYPAAYHNNAGNVSFADGHSETHRWKDPRTTPVLRPGQVLTLNVYLPGNVDTLWLAQHSAGLSSYP